MKKKIVLLGPTGIGKTDLSIELALKINAEIISADSMQIYKYIDIGTAKPDSNQLSKVKHHLISIISPNETFNVVKYISVTKNIIKEISDKEKGIIITGGTGMYVRGLIQGILPEENDDHEIRLELEQNINKYGIEYLLNELKSVDPLKHEQFSKTPNDHRRIIRALAFYKANGIPLSNLQNNWNSPLPKDFIQIGLKMEREQLYERINKRVDKMIDNGFIDEVKNLLSLNIPENFPCWQAIGYRTLALYLKNQLSLDEAIDKIKQDSRRYAKRQLTWFNKIDSIKWLNVNENTLNEIIATLEKEQVF